MTTSTQTPAEPPGEIDRAGTAAPRDHHSRRSMIRWTLALLATLLAATVIATVIVGLGVQRDAADAKIEIAKGRRALSDGDLATALERFNAAEAAFEDAQSRSSGGVGGLVARVPILGRSMDVAAGISDAGVVLAGAAVDLTTALEQLPDGLGSLAPVQGRIPIDSLAELSDDVAVAAAAGDTALASVRATPSTLIPATVAEARFEAEEQVAELARTLEAASVLTSRLPAILGADGAKRYLLIAESPAEQRGTGGIWGAYTVMTARDGRLTFEPFSQLADFPEISPDELPAPSPDYRENYDQYGGAGAWSDLNMTPDLPSASRAVLSAFEHATGSRLDGVLVADPYAVQELIRVTGPAVVPSLGVSIRAGTVVDFMTNEAYTLFPFRGRLRKAVLGAVVGEAFNQFLAQPGSPTDKLEAIVRSVAAGHLRLYTTDATSQDALITAGLDSGLRARQGTDLLAVHVNSRSGSKVDFYAERTIDYDVRLGGDGEAFATTAITIRNDAPTSGIPGYVIDPNVRGYEPGDNVSLVSMSCPHPCGLVTASRNGTDIALARGDELGFVWYQDFFTTPGGSSTALEIVTHRRGVWQGNSSGGTYRLVLLPQTTVKPTEMTVEISAPQGTGIVWASQRMSIDGGTAVWSGVPEGRTELVVRFRAPLPLRWWRNVTRALP